MIYPHQLMETARNGHTPTVEVERVRLDAGGYDRVGKYWGAGMPLYHVIVQTELDRGCVHFHLRAANIGAARKAAHEHVRIALDSAMRIYG